MTKIVSMIHPFDVVQTFYVYRDGDEIESLNYNLPDFNKMLLALTNKYNAHTVDMIGPEKYTKGIVNGYIREEISKYNKQVTEFNFI